MLSPLVGKAILLQIFFEEAKSYNSFRYNNNFKYKQRLNNNLSPRMDTQLRIKKTKGQCWCSQSSCLFSGYNLQWYQQPKEETRPFPSGTVRYQLRSGTQLSPCSRGGQGTEHVRRSDYNTPGMQAGCASSIWNLRALPSSLIWVMPQERNDTPQIWHSSRKQITVHLMQHVLLTKIFR